MKGKRFKLVFAGLLLGFLIYPHTTKAQSTILSTPNYPDIFATLESGSDFFAIAFLILALIALLARSAANAIRFFIFVFLRKSKNQWGVVYNSISKLPICNMIVYLFNIKDNSSVIIGRCKSDSAGKYGFPIKKGEYRLGISCYKYEFPSKFVKVNPEKNDYFGEKFVITQLEEKPNYNIPVDPIFKATASFETLLYYYGRRLGIPLLLLGTIFSLYSLYYYPNELRLTVAAVYSITWFVIMIDLYKNTKGIRVISIDNSIPVEQAIVEFYSDNNKKDADIILTTDETGKVVPPIKFGRYFIKVHRPYKNSVQGKIYFSTRLPFRQTVIRI